jgi:hypothetical protein
MAVVTIALIGIVLVVAGPVVADEHGRRVCSGPVAGTSARDTAPPPTTFARTASVDSHCTP